MSKRSRMEDPADERLDTDFESFEEEEDRQRSRMARELKIGLAVIFALVVVLAVVLYNRLSPANESPSASAEGQSEELSEAPKFDAAAPETETSSASWAPPTIVPAIAGPEGPTQAVSAADLDSWGPPAGASQVAEGNLGGTAPSSPPSLAPKLVSVAPADRYAGYGSAEPVGAATSRVVASDGVESGGPAQRSDLLPGAAISSGKGVGQESASSVADSSGLHLPTTQVKLAPPPAASEASDALAPSTPEPNPLRGLASAAEPAGESRVGPGRDDTSQFAPPPQAFQGEAGQAPLPTAEASPAPTYRIAAPSSELTRQADVSGSGSDPTVPSVPRQSNDTLVTGQNSQRWAPGATVIESDPPRPSLLSRDSTSAVSGGRDAGTGASLQQGTYVVQPNDNYWAISEKVYGTGTYFKALAYHNRAKIPDEHRLQVGDVVMAPDASELSKAYPDLCPKPAHREAAQRRSLAGGRQPPVGPGRVYVVQEGDNLFDIARCELGKATRWTEIVDLNRQVLGASLEDLNYLTPGMKLILPHNQPAGELSRRPDSSYQR